MAKMSSHHRVDGLLFGDGEKDHQEGLTVELLLLHIKTTQLRWFRHLDILLQAYSKSPLNTTYTWLNTPAA